jgi:hypothetical protein
VNPPSGLFPSRELKLKHVRRAELQEYPDLAAEIPALHPLAIDDAHDADLRHLDALAGRRQSVKTRLVSAASSTAPAFSLRAR